MNREQYQSIRDIIDRHGQLLQFVRRSEDDPVGFQPFIYTIGNHEQGLPELLFVCDKTDGFGGILNTLGEMQRQRGNGLAPNELVDLGGKFPVRILDGGVLGREEYAIQVGVFYGTRDFQVRQVLLCDRDGRWPGDPDCAAPFASQPILIDPTHGIVQPRP